jgi:hypothetical protein
MDPPSDGLALRASPVAAEWGIIARPRRSVNVDAPPVGRKGIFLRIAIRAVSGERGMRLHTPPSTRSGSRTRRLRVPPMRAERTSASCVSEGIGIRNVNKTRLSQKSTLHPRLFAHGLALVACAAMRYCNRHVGGIAGCLIRNGSGLCRSRG